MENLNPWDGLPSIWDGWDKQCFFKRWDDSGATCALGWIDRRFGMFGIAVYNNPRINSRKQRLADYIRKELPAVVDLANQLGGTRDSIDDVVIAAASNCLLTPEQFRELDRRLEYEYQQQQLGKQIDAIEQDFTDRKVEFTDRKVEELVEV